MKSIIQKREKYVQAYREYYRGDEEVNRRNRNDQYRSRHHLTIPQLNKRVECVESLREQYPSSRDDFHQSVLDDLQEIKRLVLNPPEDLPSAATIANEETEKLLAVLEVRQRDFPNDTVTNRLLFYGKEFQRDIGDWTSSRTFTAIRRVSKEVREMSSQYAELPDVAHALIVDVEINRGCFFATTNRKYFENARIWLDAAEYICEQALARVSNEQKQRVAYLRYYMNLIRLRLAFDAGEVEQAAPHLQTAQQRWAAFADTFGNCQAVSMATFLSSIMQAEYHLQRGAIDDARRYLGETESIFPNMEWRSIESQQHIALIKTELALAANDREYHIHLQNYISLYHRYPCFEYRYRLQEFARQHPEKAAEVKLPNDNVLFLDTTYTHIHPFLLHV